MVEFFQSNLFAKQQELPGLEKEQESTKVGLFLLGLVLFAVAIVLASNVVGASTLGVFISQIVGLSIINTSGLGYES